MPTLILPIYGAQVRSSWNPAPNGSKVRNEFGAGDGNRTHAG